LKTHPFTRPTIVAAIEFLGGAASQAKFDQVLVRLGLDTEIQLGPARSVAAKAALLGAIVTRRSTQAIQTIGGEMTLAEAVVRTAVELSQISRPELAPFLRGLALDGYVIAQGDAGAAPQLRAALPADIDLPAADDEVHVLLKQFGFLVPLGHLDQAIQAHTRGEWAAANSQIRTFLEGLLDDIARKRFAQKAAPLLTSENRRALLANEGFLSLSRNEWSPDGKGYINGLFKMLHTDGSHPGLSDDDHSTFRLHLALITARMLQRRLHDRS
jgi:hypothetical protein